MILHVLCSNVYFYYQLRFIINVNSVNLTVTPFVTGASEPKNMAYMNRLGIWGTGTPFKEFSDFIHSVEKRYVISESHESYVLTQSCTASVNDLVNEKVF